MSAPRPSKDYPPGLQGGMEHDEDAHRVGETGQTGPEATGDIQRGHPEWRETPPPNDKKDAGRGT
ncbi:hypothetical protein [Roseateles amylovorans]|uniref:Uncharacterized protein n=1 Tax=Roseateles amylovorans TaxID=2978473 RepID=A0ABY6AXR1_9BURK|nr:hypothetical protein [Roseateles amylovorans]UXH77462.1 hypothetical protein N4261_21080 [Roseateles amylovorans]